MVVFGKYENIKDAQNRLSWKQSEFLSQLPFETITTAKYKNSPDGKYISFLDFKVIDFLCLLTPSFTSSMESNKSVKGLLLTQSRPLPSTWARPYMVD